MKRVVSVILAASFVMGQTSVLAAQQDSAMEGTQESTFDACKEKGIRLVSDAEYKKDPAKFKAACDAGSVQIMPDSAIFSLAEFKDHQNGEDFLVKVGERVRDTYKKNIEFMTGLKACFAADKADDAACKARREEVAKSLDKAAKAARAELLLAKTKTGNERFMGMKGNNIGLNTELDPYSIPLGSVGGANYPVSGVPATPAEIETAQKAIGEEYAAAQKAADENVAKEMARLDQEKAAGNMSEAEYGNHVSELKTKAPKVAKEKLNDLMHAHIAGYRSIIEDQMPILSSIEKAAYDKDSNTFKWTDSQVAAGLDKAIERAQKQLGSTEAALKSREMEHWTGEGLYKRTLEGHSDLFSFMMYGPAVNDVLKQNPQFCGVADGIVSHKSKGETRFMIGSMATFMVGGGALGVGAKAFNLVKTGGAIGTAMVGSGLGMGAFDIAHSFSDLNETRDQVLARSGLGKKGVEEDTVRDAKDIAEKENGLLTSVGMNMLFGGFGGGVGAGAHIAGAEVKAAYKAGGSQGVRDLIATSAENVKAKIAGIFNRVSAKSTAAELEAARGDTVAAIHGLEKADAGQVKTLTHLDQVAEERGLLKGEGIDNHRGYAATVAQADQNVRGAFEGVVAKMNPEVYAYDKDAAEGVNLLLRTTEEDVARLPAAERAKALEHPEQTLKQELREKFGVSEKEAGEMVDGNGSGGCLLGKK